LKLELVFVLNVNEDAILLFMVRIRLLFFIRHCTEFKSEENPLKWKEINKTATSAVLMYALTLILILVNNTDITVSTIT
jgi:hypothetical protein